MAESFKEALIKAIDTVGKQEELADRIGVHQSQISHWLNRDKNGVSPRFCIPIEQATGGRVPRYDLRPDVFGEAPDSED